MTKNPIKIGILGAKKIFKKCLTKKLQLSIIINGKSYQRMECNILQHSIKQLKILMGIGVFFS